MSGWRLLIDVGGTNVRFARASDGHAIAQRRSYLVSRFPTFMSALRTYLDETREIAGCSGVAIGAAGPVDAGAVCLTNSSWTISEEEVSAALGSPCVLINDLQAAAMSLPALSEESFRMIGEPRLGLNTPSRLLITNMGTGFGAATLLKTGSGWMACPGEAGHMTVHLPSSLGLNLPDHFTSVEHILSGPGLSSLHCAMSGDAPLAVPTDIFTRAHDDLRCRKTLESFTHILGDVLGNLALAVAAWDGVFLCGGVSKAFVDVANTAALRKAFEEKGAMKERMRSIPIALVLKEDAALIGLAATPMHAP